MNLLYVKDATESVESVGKHLEEAAEAHKFGVITMIDLKGKMAEKGINFPNKCRIYELCNARQAKQVLEKNMEIATALPCRIAVYEDRGHVRIATMLPTEILAMFDFPELGPIARDVERHVKAILDESVSVKNAAAPLAPRAKIERVDIGVANPNA